MPDFLFNRRARAVIQRLGLPVTLPTPLARASGPWTARPLADRSVVVGAARASELLPVVAGVLVAAGADPFLADPALAPAFADTGPGYGRPARPAPAEGDVDAL